MDKTKHKYDIINNPYKKILDRTIEKIEKSKFTMSQMGIIEFIKKELQKI